MIREEAICVCLSKSRQGEPSGHISSFSLQACGTGLFDGRVHTPRIDRHQLSMKAAGQHMHLPNSHKLATSRDVHRLSAVDIGNIYGRQCRIDTWVIVVAIHCIACRAPICSF